MDLARNFNPPDNPALSPGYSHINVGPLTASTKPVSFAGQFGYDSVTKILPATPGEQGPIASANVSRCLKAAGSEMEDINQVRHHIVEMQEQDSQQLKLRGELQDQFMGDHRPSDPAWDKKLG